VSVVETRRIRMVSAVENSCVCLCTMPGVERPCISLTSVVKTSRIYMVSVVETTGMSTASAVEICLICTLRFQKYLMYV